VNRAIAQEGLPSQPAGKKETRARKETTFGAVATYGSELEDKLSKVDTFNYADITLQDVVDDLRTKTGIPIILDKGSLADEGIGTDQTVSIRLRDFPTNKLLDLMLDEMDLAWLVRDGYVLITTKTALETLQEMRVYNCSDLIEMVPPKPPAKGGFGGPGQTGGFFAVGEVGGSTAAENPTVGQAEQTTPELIADNDSLIELIQNSVEPDTWTDAGGSASIEAYHGGLLVITHSGPTHRRIERLLNMMRQAREAEPGTVVREW
jgi:general secretion pathway protein D